METTIANAETIAVRDFRAIFLWPLRLSPGCDELGVQARHNQNCSASKWLDKYADWICAANGGSARTWEPSGPYREHRFRRRQPSPESRYAEFVYFHPFIQRFLYGHPDKQPAVRMLHRKDIATARVQLCEHGPVFEFPVERVQLLLFPSDVAILAVQLNHPATGPANPHPSGLTLADAQDFLDWGRRVYSPFWYPPHVPRKVPFAMSWRDSAGAQIGKASDFACIDVDQTTVPVAAHWKSLAAPLTPSGGGLNFEQVEDDRLPTLAYISVDRPEEIGEPDFIRLAFLDDRGKPDRYPYGREFLLSDFTREYCYDRFWSPNFPEGWSTRFLCAGYSFVAVGRSSDDTFSKTISTHVEQHYFVLALIAHLQKASLLAFWARLADLVHEFENDPPNRESRDRFFVGQKWLLEDIADFSSRFWFTEVSNQLQAVELFDMWTKRLKTRELFTQVMDQTRFVREVQFNQFQEDVAKAQTSAAQTQVRLATEQGRVAEAQTRIAKLAAYFAPPATIAAAGSLLLSVPGASAGIRWLAGCRSQGCEPNALAFTGILIVIAILFLLCCWVLNKWLQGRLAPPSGPSGVA